MAIKAKENLDNHLQSGHLSNDPNYLAWKEAKVISALEQTKDRDSMISSKKIWDKLSLEH